MAIQIFGTGKCFETKKAQRFFKERRVNFQFIDLKEKGFSKGELESIVHSLAKDFSGKEEVLDFMADLKNRDFASFKYLDDEDFRFASGIYYRQLHFDDYFRKLKE